MPSGFFSVSLSLFVVRDAGLRIEHNVLGTAPKRLVGPQIIGSVPADLVHVGVAAALEVE